MAEHASVNGYLFLSQFILIWDRVASVLTDPLIPLPMYGQSLCHAVRGYNLVLRSHFDIILPLALSHLCGLLAEETDNRPVQFF